VANNQDVAKTSGKILFVFWQCRPEKPTRPLTLNKDKLWCGLILNVVKLIHTQQTVQPLSFNVFYGNAGISVYYKRSNDIV
jgi:hypothetical protein